MGQADGLPEQPLPSSTPAGAPYPPVPRPAGYPASGITPNPYPPLTTVQGTPVNHHGGHHPAAAPAGYMPADAPPVGTGYAASGSGPGYAMNTDGAGDDRKAGPIACVAIVLFILGIFMPFLWVVVAFLPFCARRQSVRTQLLLRRLATMAAIALAIYLILGIVFGVLGGTRWNRGGGYYGGGAGGNTGRLCQDAAGRTFYC